MQLASRTALVTGGAVRIGAAICRALAERGCRVIIHCHRSSRQARALADELRGTGGQAWVLTGRLGSRDGCQKVIDEAVGLAGKLDILVNNASVFRRGSLAESSPEDLVEELDVNLVVPMLLTRAFALHRGARNAAHDGPPAGKVINLLDRRISGNEEGACAYQVSKQALAAFTRIAALELAPAVTVNGVAPGAVLPPSRDSQTAREPAGAVPLRAAGTPADVAAAVVFLLESDSITGQVVFVDGGQHLAGSAGGS